MPTILLTKEKRKALEVELITLQTKERHKMAKLIADARSHGDLSENADYDAAKEAQGLLELRISKIGAVLSNSQVVNPADFPDGEAHILSHITVKNLKLKKEFSYQLVSDAEADFEQNKISTESPLGKALLGKKVGDIAEMVLPRGTQKFEIIALDSLS
ncbi:MAG: transcription elongation factor GreA [Bacteroidetes bacterium 4572_77]|nr:MAG: transcription elongation factor GreA [Bacteroidetes bacterium 4572_77]